MTIARKLRLLGAAPAGWPDATRYLLCEGLEKPRRGCDWRVVGWLDYDAAPMRALSAVRDARIELDQAHAATKAVFLNLSEGRAHHERADAAVKVARLRLRKARGICDVVFAAADAGVDMRLGRLVVPGDCPDVEFRE